MNPSREPTNSENVTSRLFFRFFLCYLIAAPVAWLLAVRGTLPIRLETVGTAEFLFIPLALLGALLTVTKPYLLALTAIKAFYDVALLYRLTGWVRLGTIGFLPWNACLLLLILSLLLFAVAAARAELFSFLTAARDTRLLLSKPFGKFLIEALIFLALGITLYYLWPQLMAKFGMLSIPF